MRALLIALLYGLFLYFFKSYSLEQTYLPVSSALLIGYVIFTVLDFVRITNVTVKALLFSSKLSPALSRNVEIMMVAGWSLFLMGNSFSIAGASILMNAIIDGVWSTSLLVGVSILLLLGFVLRRFKITFKKKVGSRIVTYSN